jgi:hypothetical protein
MSTIHILTDFFKVPGFNFGRVSIWPSLWPSGQSSWLQIQRSAFDFRRYLMFWEVVCPERGPFSLVSTTEELLERKGSGSGQENREYWRRNPLSRPRGTLYPQILALTSPTNGGRSVSIVCSRTQATEFWSQSLLRYVIVSCMAFIHCNGIISQNVRTKIFHSSVFETDEKYLAAKCFFWKWRRKFAAARTTIWVKWHKN